MKSRTLRRPVGARRDAAAPAGAPGGAAMRALAGAVTVAAATLAFLVLLAWPPAVPAQPAAAAGASGYSEKGADTCLDCHDPESDSTNFSTGGIFKNRHAHRGNARAPFGVGGLQCEACHGPGALHSAKGGKRKGTINSLKAGSGLSAAERSQPCLTCHQGGTRTGWHAAAHERSDLGCTDCHKLHVERDPVLARASQAEVCHACHQAQRVDFMKVSAQPVVPARSARAGQMSCGDCHAAHGSQSAAMLIKPTINQTCFSS